MISSDFMHETMLSQTRIVQEEGGDENAFVAAVKYVCRCILLGGNWLAWKSWTEQYKFLYIDEEYDEEMEKAWALHEEADILAVQEKEGGTDGEGEDTTDDGEGGSEDEDDESAPAKKKTGGKAGKKEAKDSKGKTGKKPEAKESGHKKDKKKEKKKDTKKDKEKDKDKDKDKEDKKRTGKKSALDKQIAASLAQTKTMAQLLLEGQTIEKLIKTKEEWAWARNEEASGKFSATMKSLKAASGTSFAQTMSQAKNAKAVKNSMAEKELTKNLETYLAKVEPLCATLRKQVTWLQDAHEMKMKID